MNTIVYTKAMVGVNAGIIRRCCSRQRFYIDNHSLSLLFPYTSTLEKLIVSRIDPVIQGSNIQFSYSQNRSFHFAPAWRGQEPSSKVEETVKSLKEEKEEKEKMTVAVASDVTKIPDKAAAQKRTLWQKIKAEMLHYYHGFRLLGLDMKISAKLIYRVLKGKELTRREHRLLVKTTGDMFRLIPFSVFIIVPFMEFLLPVAIKFFPGMLPSTFQTATEKEDKLKQALKVKIEMAKFLQKTLDEMAVQSPNHKSEKAKEFSEFFYKLRSTGATASNEEIMKFSKLFEDEITLDSLSRPQLIALCRVLDVQTLGTTNFLRYLLRMRLRSLAADDRLIEKEGVETLTRAELQQACRARGMRAYGMPENKLRDQLSQWLDLSIHKKVPPSLLLLSRALMVPETMPMSDKLKVTISALPDDVLAATKGAIGEKEGKVDHRTNIEIIKMEERKIEEERKEKKETKEPEPVITARDEKKDEITTKDVKVLEQALDSIGKDKKLVIEKEELKELKEEMAEYQEDIKELDQMKAEAQGEIEDLKVSKGAKRLFNKVNKMILKMDDVLKELEKSEEQVKKKIETLKPEEKEGSEVVEELVKVDELIAAIKQIQSVPDENRLSRISEILGKIDDDRDGTIKIEDVLKVIELIGKEDVKLNKKQLNEIIDLIDKEEVLEVEDQISKALKKESKDKSPEEVQPEKTSPVPSAPPTKSEKPLNENLNDGTTPKIPVNSIAEELRDPAPVLKDPLDSECIRSSSLTSVPPPKAKKTEGSKQL
ncbi:mitochondrial proton/calcium exchanger protein isoform X2 [Diachasma alloeum]|uniref:mitochondrial proton/calcium exchanger protein isoform X2 n=1 Tax=Diachasma alloeum TaxID=454923 RepID=UPI0007382B91|nr:mitochondrial proton/calcium exchanger protein isoform X2 [Diachasma alloeum]